MARDSEREQPLVLVIDREQGVLDEVSELLAGSGFECRCCTTAEEATTTALTDPPDLIICDWSLRGADGVGACQHIKQQPGMDRVPVMFLSGSQRPDIIRRAHAGDNGVYCLRKPFAPKVLVELVDQAMAVPVARA